MTAAYRDLTKKNRAGVFCKVDLHVHSPASKDYVRSKVDSTDEEEYLHFLKGIAESDVSMVAITDHNTFRGYFDIQDLTKSKPDVRSELSGKVILPGIEITCYNKHFLAIFPPQPDPTRLMTFLLDCGIELLDQGLGACACNT